MGISEIVNIVIALATCIAAACAFLAARAAGEQVKLQRPRPVITIEGNWSLESTLDDEPHGFLLQNVGSSPAFDIKVSDIVGPLLYKGHRERLTTDPVPLLAEGKKPLEAIHRRYMPGSAIGDGAALKFVQNASETLPPQDGQKLSFFVEYSALDGTRFKTECLICFSLGLPNPRAQIVPCSSWLGEGSR